MGLSFDFSFSELFIKHQISASFANELVNHRSSDIIYQHYRNYNLEEEILSKGQFLQRVLKPYENKDPHEMIHLQDTIEYIKSNIDIWKPLIEKAILSNSPQDYTIDSTIFFSIGYDMGIAYDNDVVLDISYKFYQKHPDEILYFIIHELSHVVLYHYHPPIDFGKLSVRGDLRKVARYHTLLEGLGVFLPYDLRKQNKSFEHIDYQVLGNMNKMKLIEAEFYDLMKKLDDQKDVKIEVEDWESISIFSQKRYWYTFGAYMALEIRKTLGIEVVIECISKGEDLFFESYEKTKDRGI